DRGEDLPGVLVAEQAEDAQGLLGEGLHRAEQRGLLVEGLAGPAGEGGRDDQGGAVGALVDEGGAGRVPRRVAARPQGGADGARGARGRRGLARDQSRAADRGGGPVAAGRLQGAVVRLGGQAGHGLAEVGEVRGRLLDGPVLHGGGDGVGGVGGQGGRLFDGL